MTLPLHRYSTFLDQLTGAPEQRITLTPDWAQGRAIYGGMAAGLLGPVMELQLDDPSRHLRSALVSFVGPAEATDADLRVETLRSGRNVTQLDGRLIQDGAIRTQMVASFGADRSSGVSVEAPTRPEVALSPEDSRGLPYLKGVTPEFTRHFDMHWTRGNMPFSDAQPDFSGWCRFREPAGCGPAWLLGLIDAWPPSTLPSMPKPAAISSLTWAVDVVTPTTDVDPEGWWYYDVHTHAAANGFCQSSAQIWRPDGALAAVSRQTVAVFA